MMVRLRILFRGTLLVALVLFLLEWRRFHPDGAQSMPRIVVSTFNTVLKIAEPVQVTSQGESAILEEVDQIDDSMAHEHQQPQKQLQLGRVELGQQQQQEPQQRRQQDLGALERIMDSHLFDFSAGVKVSFDEMGRRKVEDKGGLRMGQLSALEYMLKAGFGVVVLAYGSDDASQVYMAQAMVLLLQLEAQSPQLPIEVFVSEEVLGQQQQRLDDAGLRARAVALNTTGYPEGFGHKFKPVAIKQSRFQVVLFLDTDVRPCQGSIESLASIQLRHHYDLFCDKNAHAQYSATNHRRGLMFDIPEEERESLKNFGEPNSGVMLMDKRTETGRDLLDGWVEESVKWHEQWFLEYGNKIQRESDQGALRLALFKRRFQVRWFNFWKDPRNKRMPHPRIQCHVTRELDVGCEYRKAESPKCLMRHGLSYKYFHATKSNRTVLHDEEATRAYETALRVMGWSAGDFHVLTRGQLFEELLGFR